MRGVGWLPTVEGIALEIEWAQGEFGEGPAADVTVLVEEDFVATVTGAALPDHVLIGIVERVTGRGVCGFAGSVSIDAGLPLSVEVFLLEPAPGRDRVDEAPHPIPGPPTEAGPLPADPWGAPVREWEQGRLRITSRAYGEEVLVVALAGELDLSNVAGAEVELGAAVGSRQGLVVVDCEELEFLDASGVAMLFSLGDRLREGDSLRVLPGQAPAVRRVFDLTGLGATIKLADDGPPLSSPIK
jgi:anti-anti-sigma factor